MNYDEITDFVSAVLGFYAEKNRNERNSFRRGGAYVAAVEPPHISHIHRFYRISCGMRESGEGLCPLFFVLPALLYAGAGAAVGLSKSLLLALQQPLRLQLQRSRRLFTNFLDHTKKPLVSASTWEDTQ